MKMTDYNFNLGISECQIEHTRTHVGDCTYMVFGPQDRAISTFSPDYEPRYYYYLNSRNLSYNLFYNLQTEPQEP